MRLGDESYGHIAQDGKGKIRVGKYCSIASEVKAVFLQGHRTDWISTFPFPVRWKTDVVGHPVEPEAIIVENDVWIGKFVTLLEGTKLRNGSVIGAYSVVAGEVPPYCIAVGNPAKVIRQRFEDPIIMALLKLQWWDWPKEKIEKYAHLLCSNKIEELLQVMDE